MLQIVRGLVRPFIAFAFVMMTCVMAYFGKIDGKDVLAIVGIIIGFYFGERSALKKPDAEVQDVTPKK